MTNQSGNLSLSQAACLEALHKQLRNLEETIASPFRLSQSLPQGEVRNRLLDEVSSLDSIADVMRRILDAMEGDDG